ncbi:porin family protein [Cytophaga aurantiaca]|uniref:porin family protein n=1 Tax=Cytophaga aurantiaca TaxID=29530 RepID=UPI00037DF39E|nr:porin family protein [Cytophaga aurantiaca]
MKTLSILFTAILLSYSVIAQDSKFEIGLQAGPNLTAMRYASDMLQANRYPQVAGIAGLFVQYNINNTFALRIDPAFERLADKTDKITYTNQNDNMIGPGTTHFHYDYITIPVLVRASIGNKLKYFLNVGPSFSFLLNQSVISDWTPDRKTNRTDYYQTLNFGITGGIGVALPIKEKFSLSFEIRDNLGLTNISTSTNSNYAFRSNATSLLVGFAYKLGKGSSKATFTPTF